MWRKSQQLANDFWNAWRHEYLGQITKRQRWELPQKDVNKDDIVMIVDENLPRNQWTIGIITEVKLGSDDRVRNVKVKLANAGIDNKGKQIFNSATIDRPIQKVVLLQKAENSSIGIMLYYAKLQKYTTMLLIFLYNHADIYPSIYTYIIAF
ncbi:hypothetical protein EB796_015746 [Bugula neritina]|uniref:DUF5641 domain-containing protein n=1 Tax=Bugula neritina TaxID=10212 RepID=A0A7J7JI42_BUGNE|nr:hypothetical protein EB796_015746 [Bugula neritina]